MGAKSRVIPGFLDTVLAEELEPGDTVVDLMAGSGVVSAFCAGRYRVFANDVQLYSTVIARSLIEHHPDTKPSLLATLDVVEDLSEVFSQNLERLSAAYAPALEEERRFLAEYRDTGGEGKWPSRYRNFLERARRLWPGCRVPARSRLYGGAREILGRAAQEARREDPTLRPASLATTYWGNVYFGLEQAIEIDSLRAAIADLDGHDELAEARRTHYLSALLHAASVTTSGTSHFAQPRHLKKDSELRAMARRRLASVFDVFAGYSDEIADTVRQTIHVGGNVASTGDYQRTIDPADGAFRFPGDIDLVYLDPPYTADNYSRFYHVLEVLARYDYPELQRDRSGEILRGRYPALSDRFQSGFCRAARVEDEFRTVIRAAAASGAKLVISYSSPTGLLLKQFARDGDRPPLERFRDLCRESYGAVRILERPLMHSGQGDSNISIDELLVVCTEPR